MKHENFNFFDIDQIICYCLKIVCNKTFLQECQMDHLPVSVHGRKVLWLHNLLAAPYMAASCPCICLCRLSMHLVCYTLSLALFFKPAKQPTFCLKDSINANKVQRGRSVMFVTWPLMSTRWCILLQFYVKAWSKGLKVKVCQELNFATFHKDPITEGTHIHVFEQLLVLVSI